MVHIVDPHILEAIAKALTGPPMATSPATAEAIYRKAVETGWIALCEIESLMLAVEPRLYRITPRELLALFNIRRQFVVERPSRGVFDTNGVERISAVDLAALLVEMESRGLAVDPLPLCSALMPALSSKGLLNQAELAAYFRAQGHVEPQATTFSTELAADQMTGWEFEPDGHETQTGFWVEVVPGSPGTDAIEVTPPANIARLPAPAA